MGLHTYRTNTTKRSHHGPKGGEWGARQVVTTLTNGTRSTMFLKWKSAASDNIRGVHCPSAHRPILSCFIAPRSQAIRLALDMCILYLHVWSYTKGSIAVLYIY